MLVRGVNWVGDAVMSMPALGAIRKAYPGRRVTLLVKPGVAGLFEKDPSVDDIILYEGQRGLQGRLALARRLKKENFQTAILLQNAFDAALIAFLSRIPERIGYSRDLRGFLLTKRVPYKHDDRKIHHTRYFLNVLEGAGIFPVAEGAADHLSPWVYLDLEERLAARERLRGLPRPVIGLAPGAAFGSSKRWPPARFRELALRVVKDLGGSVAVFGSEAETDQAAGIVSGPAPTGWPVPEGLVSFAGKTSLRELCALLAEVDALVCNDSGAMHLGYAAGTPVVALFGSTDPSLTGPPGPHKIIRKELSCSPCFERECPQGAPECMESITAEEVFAGLKKILPSRRAVFFDRDGTICKDTGFLNRMEDFELSPDIGALARLKEKGFMLIGLTNQSGIARGMVEEGFVKKINSIFMRDYGFDAFYYCPHHPEERCVCRKPSPQLFMRARLELGVDLKSSFMVGDKDSDMLAALAAGVKGVLISEETGPVKPVRVRSLGEAVNYIMENAQGWKKINKTPAR